MSPAPKALSVCRSKWKRHCSDFLRSSFDSRFHLLSDKRNDRLAEKQNGHSLDSCVIPNTAANSTSLAKRGESLQSAALLEHDRTQDIYRQPVFDSWGRVHIPRTYWALWTAFLFFPNFPQHTRCRLRVKA